ncbi:1-aminocyclopropane-1-carboxylate deaminase/D-cysteine desulfhydrase [Psychroflexus aestuariivivens]|uniref:1-aminocyclopropane-1-carboxylate deaminase/D-cysteine desulfhydrase n=1 Tax=Psychroflexus aestuariivivens TaxID=1795040 RepID=UPI000FDBB57E|nr:pyridoxal-phosphate dependent enzyme [Psychroflexus aestuariivivens]
MKELIFFENSPISENEFVLEKNNVSLYIKREDLIHPFVSGNKFRKLKYNLLEAKSKNAQQILTFGGAFSNHIAATAKACEIMKLPSIGIIRGEELRENLSKTLSQNKTLAFAVKSGMTLKFVNRTDYRQKVEMPLVQEIIQKSTSTYVIPEGGTNELAIKGCREILKNKDDYFDVICSSIGTGGTFSGLIEASKSHQKLIGFPALKGDFLKNEIQKYTSKTNWIIDDEFHFGGYAKIDSELIRFINDFKTKFRIQLDPIYTGKMIFGILQRIEDGYFSKNTRILAVHTGGLQGIEGMNVLLDKKGLEKIHYNDV